MSDQHASASAPQPKPRLQDTFRATGAEGWVVVDQSESVTGTPRQKVIGALILGVCVVFLAALLGVQHLDTALQVAVLAFVMAIPILALDFMFSAFKFAAGLRKFLELYTAGLQMAAWTIGDGLGSVAVLVGIGAVVWHLSEGAFWIGLATPAVAFLAIILVALAYAFMHAWREEKERQAKAGGPPPSAQDSPTPPAAE